MNDSIFIDSKKRMYIIEGLFKDYLLQKYARKVKIKPIKKENINNNRVVKEHNIDLIKNANKNEIISNIKRLEKSDEVIVHDYY